MFAKRPAQHVGDAHDKIVKLDDVRVHVPAPRKCQQLVGELGAESRGILRLLEESPRFVVQETGLQQLQVARDHEEQVIEVMGDAAG